MMVTAEAQDLNSSLLKDSSPPCPTQLSQQDYSRIENDYRESTISNLSNLYNNDLMEGSFYTGQTGNKWFDLGLARAIWAGAYDPSGNLKLAASTYNNGNGSDYISGPHVFGDVSQAALSCMFFRRVWVVSQVEVDNLRSDFSAGILMIDQIPEDILEWPAKGNPWIAPMTPDSDMAPFHDFNGDGRYDPMMGDYPLPLMESPDFIPHQFRFYVFSDGWLHSFSGGDALNMDFHVIDFVTDCPEQAESEAAVFSRIKYINRGIEDLRNLRMGIWDDTDLGCLSDDYFGCRPDLDCSYTYNQGGFDSEFCPTVASPFNLSVVRSLIFPNGDLKGYTLYNNSGVVGGPTETAAPQVPEDFYNYLSNQWLDGSPITEGGTGLNPGSNDVTKFLYPDFPNDQGGWSMETEGLPLIDKRSLSVFTDTILVPGQSGTVDFIDYMLVDDEHPGLDVFLIFEERVRAVKADFAAMKRGDYDCTMPSTSSNDLVEKSTDVRLFPNPVDNELRISFKEKLSGSLKIFSVDGKCLVKRRLNNENEVFLEVQALGSGFYSLVFEMEDGEGVTKYFVRSD